MPTQYPIELTRTIRDPIHGDLQFTEEELRIIDHAVFRRMHRIRQNGLLYLVFPSATHTRFEHSLGTVFVADSMLRALLFNCRAATEKPTPAVAKLAEAQDRQAVDFNDLQQDQLEYVFRITRLAALVHDLGHGPFSHTFDSFAPKASRIRELIENTPCLAVLAPLAEALGQDPEEAPTLFTKLAPSRVEHEVMSCVLFTYIWNGIEPSDAGTAGDVAAVILRKPELASAGGFRKFFPLMSDVVSSAPADADRMDYLERDSRAVGVTYGLFDRNRVLKSLLPFRQNDTGGDTQYRLGFKISGLPAVENFVQARFELFAQIYFHKTNRAVQLMLEQIAKCASSQDIQLYDWSGLEDLRRRYLELTDERFLMVLGGSDHEFQIEGAEIQDLGKAIRDRKLWKRVFEGQPDGMRVVYKRLDQDGLTDGILKDGDADPDAAKGLDKGAPLLRRDRHGFYTAQNQGSWREASPVIRSLAEADTTVARLYLTQSDRNEAKKIKDAVRRYQN